MALDGLADALGDDQGARGRRLRQHHHELVPAVAGQDVALAHRLRQDGPHLGQGARAGQVPVRVVDALEAVEVQEDHGERDAVALAALDLAPDVEVEVARVEELGEVVGDGELLGALEEDGVLDGDGAGLDQGEQQLQVGLGELPAQLVDDLHHADGAPARDEGRAEDGAGAGTGSCCRSCRAKRGSLEVSLTMAGLPVWATQPAMPSPIFTRNDGDVLALLPQRQLEGQLLLLLVHHQHGPGLGGDELLDLGHDELDDLARLQDGVGGLHDVGEDGQALRRSCVSCRATSCRRLLARPRACARPRGGPAPRCAGGSPGRQEPRWKSKPSCDERLQDRRRRSAGRRCPPACRGSARRSARTAPARWRRPSSTSAPSKARRSGLARRRRARGGKNS